MHRVAAPLVFVLVVAVTFFFGLKKSEEFKVFSWPNIVKVSFVTCYLGAEFSSEFESFVHIPMNLSSLIGWRWTKVISGIGYFQFDSHKRTIFSFLLTGWSVLLERGKFKLDYWVFSVYLSYGFSFTKLIYRLSYMSAACSFSCSTGSITFPFSWPL